MSEASELYENILEEIYSYTNKSINFSEFENNIQDINSTILGALSDFYRWKRNSTSKIDSEVIQKNKVNKLFLAKWMGKDQRNIINRIIKKHKITKK